MEDETGLSDEALELIRSDVSDGEAMIAVSRAVLSGDYSEDVFRSDLLSVFEIIADESANIVLNKFGSFNSVGIPADQISSEEQSRETKAIYEFYVERFNSGLRVFRKTYGI